MANRFEIGSRVKAKINGVKGTVDSFDATTQTYTVNYDKIGLRKNQPETSLDEAPSLRTHFEPSPKTTTHFAEQVEYADFFDMLQNEASIRVQLPKARLGWFMTHYFNATGDSITDETPNVSIIKADKQGVSITVNFPAAYKGMVPPIINEWAENLSNPTGKHGFCNIAFAFELFSIGFRLGTKHSYTGIGGDRWLGLRGEQ
jgi:hypothetical protein